MFIYAYIMLFLWILQKQTDLRATLSLNIFLFCLIWYSPQQEKFKDQGEINIAPG